MKTLIKNTTRFTNDSASKVVSFIRNYELDEADKRFAFTLADVVLTTTVSKLGHRFDRKVIVPLIGKLTTPKVASKYLVLNKYAENAGTAITLGKLGVASYIWFNKKESKLSREASSRSTTFREC